MTRRREASTQLTPGKRYFILVSKVVHVAVGTHSRDGGDFISHCGERFNKRTPIVETEVVTCLRCLSHSR